MYSVFFRIGRRVVFRSSCVRLAVGIVVVCAISAGCKQTEQAPASASNATPSAEASDTQAIPPPGAVPVPPPPPAEEPGNTAANVPTCDVKASDTSSSFPNPVPQPSAWSSPLDVSFATPAPGKPLTFGDVETALNKMLTNAGYSSDQYYPFPCGFALVTRVEQTDADWTPLKPPGRWAIQTAVMQKWSIESIIRQFAHAQPGFYQVLVFVVTQIPVAYGGDHPPLAFFDETLKGGASRLPASLESRAATADVKCTVLVYEFLKENGAQAKALSPGQLDAMTHLQRASLAGLR